MRLFKSIKSRLLFFLAVVGPSTITTMAGNDGAGVITYSIAGARLGYAILFVLPVLTILYAITQEMGSRIAIVSGKGLAEVIRESYGVRISLVVFTMLLVANFATVLTNVSALKAAALLLHLPVVPFLTTIIVLSLMLVTMTNYEKSQKIFLTGMILYLSYVFSAIKGRPDWAATLQHTFTPARSMLSREYLITAIAVLGTTITPWGQFFVQSYMKDKNLAISYLRSARLEAFWGAIISNLFSFFIIVATAATLFAHHLPLISGEEAAEAIRPFAGQLSSWLFSVGLASAAVIGMIIISLSSAYAFSEFFGFEGSLDAPYDRGKSFYLIFFINIVLAGLIVILPQISLFNIVLYTQSLNAVLLPIVFYFLLKIANDRALMGRHVNSRVYNVIAIFASMIIIISAAIAAVLTYVF